MENDLEQRLRQVLAGQSEVAFAYLFGSAATGNPGRARDIDVAIGFARSPSLFELGHIAALLEDAVGREREVDVVDLASASTLLRYEVLRRGHVVVVNDEFAVLAFQARVPMEYFDLQPHIERQLVGVLRTVGTR